MSKKKKSSGLLWVVLLVVLAAVGFGLTRDNVFGDEDSLELTGAPVRRGPLKISVIQRGNLEAKNSVKIVNELEGSTTILELVAEGTTVKEGDLLVVLDDSDLRDRRDGQEISVQNTRASYTKAVQQFEIQKSQNDSDIAAAQQRVDFAETDLVKYTEGDWPQSLQESEEAIVLAEEERASAKDRLDWSKSLSDKGFLTRSELERDQLAYNRAEITLEQKKRSKELMIRYDNPKELARLRADLEESKRELDRVKLQANARLVDFEAAMVTSKARLDLEEEKLRKLEGQISKSRIYSPAAGICVYARGNGSRWGGGEPIQEGRSVREGEEIITIPREGGMIAEASIHETVLKQVVEGQPVLLQIDALPGKQYRGKVNFVAILPDQQSWWANPNQRLYKTEIGILDISNEMRPGMSCGLEIMIAQLDNVLYAPVQSIFLDGGETIAFVDDGGKPARREVVVGQANDKWVELQSGLDEGDIVLLAPPADFTPKPSKESEVDGFADWGAVPEAGAGAGSRRGPGAGGGGAPSAGFDRSKLKDLDPSKFKNFDPSKMKDFDPSKFKRGGEGKPSGSDGATAEAKVEAAASTEDDDSAPDADTPAAAQPASGS